MKTKILTTTVIFLMMTGCSNTPAVSGHSFVSSSENGSVSISFDTKHMNTLASNQYAVWIEDQNHHLIRTLYVSDFTGKRRGYEKRKDALNHWVSIADPENISDVEMDVISGPTPDDDSHTFTWNLKDDNGKTVSSGKYLIKVEGTLYWQSNVVYTGSYDTENPDKAMIVSEKRSEPDNQTNETMITNVKMKWNRE